MPTPGNTTIGDQHIRQMKTKAQKQFDRQIRQIQCSLDQQDMRLQTCLRINENMRQRLAAITGSADLKNIILPSIAPGPIAIANGKVLPPEQMLDLNEDNYDVILNYIALKLLARKDPDKRTKLEQCNCQDIGKDRLKLLRYMFEHPKVPICEETTQYIYGDVASISANALSKTFGALRTCLWNGPYIITESDWGESISRTGSMYLLKEKYKYLVIRYLI
jgi:hypothetical protein